MLLTLSSHVLNIFTCYNVARIGDWDGGGLIVKDQLLFHWYGLSLKRKLYIVMVSVTLFMAVAIALNVKVSYVFIDDVRLLMDDNLSSYKFQESFGREVTAFSDLIRDRSLENQEIYLEASKEAAANLAVLPHDFKKIGEERYATTWRILNAYKEYQNQRDKTIALTGDGQEFIEELYRTYRMQEYLKVYTSRLTKEVLNEGNDYYEERVTLLSQMPYILIVMSGLSLGLLFLMLRTMVESIVNIVLKLIDVSSGIEKNDFTVPDVTWKGSDEIGRLVSAFNNMKHAMQNYVYTLKEKRLIEDKLHQKELEKANLEQRFSFAQLQLIKSQLNPHFLFNTLNMITRMSQIEEAPITEEMLVAMSNLLRYSLRTTEPFTPLNQELKVVEDYMYIQKKRFGERIQWKIDCDTRTDEIEVPVFLLQPLVENAIIHGISSKESGGSIEISIEVEHGILQISVKDDGVGMSDEKLKQIRDAVKSRGSGLGIGLGNIYRRIAAYYEQGEVIVDSREGVGTTVSMVFGDRKK